MKAFLTIVLISCLGFTGFAQEKSMENKVVESLDGNGSFNVVIAVVLVILLGVLFYLWRLDRKVNKLMDEVKK